jgi:hypothetical protein
MRSFVAAPVGSPCARFKLGHGSRSSRRRASFAPMSHLPLAAALISAAVLGFWGCDSTEAADDDAPASDAGGADGSVDPPEDGSVEETSSIACVNVPAPTSCPEPPVRFGDISGIIGQRCATPCHNGTPNGPWALFDYGHVKDWSDLIRAALLSCTMPPLDGGVAITAEEKTAILTWLRCGGPP